MSRRRQRRQARDASVTLEFILVLPLLVVTLFGIAQFTVSLLVRQAVAQAAIVGAREAGKGEGIAEVARAVNGVLEGSHGIALATVTYSPGSAPSTPGSATVTAVANSGVRVWLEVGQPDVLQFRPPKSDFGDASVPEVLPAPAVAANEVRVTVAINLTRRPMYNWLYNFSPDYVDFSTRYLRVRSLVEKE
jgi:Flp pilus assembly protein TadG